MQAIDNALLQWLQQPAQESPFLVDLLSALTALGSWWATLSIAALAALYVLARGERRCAAALMIVVLVGRASVDALKLIINRPRPTLVDFDVVVHSLSFPSGHAGNSTITFITVALIAGAVAGRRKAALAAAVLLALAVGLTRPMLGVHWPSDVLAGWSWGAAWTLTAIWLLKPWMTGQPIARLPRSA